MTIKNWFLILCFFIAKIIAAQTTVSTGTDKYLVLEAAVSAQVAWVTEAYCIADGMRGNPRLYIVNHHSAVWGEDSLAHSSSNVWESTYITSYPSGTINRSFYNTNISIARENWENAYTTLLNDSAKYQLTMSVYKKGQQLRIFLSGKALENLPGAYHFSAIVVEDSVSYLQKNASSSRACSYLNGESILNNFQHRDVSRAVLGGPWGVFAANNPTINQVDTMSLYYTIPSSFNTSRLRIIGIVQKNGSFSYNRAIMNAIGVELSSVCDLEVLTQPANKAVLSGNSAVFSVACNKANASYQWQTKAGSGFVNASNSGQYTGANTSTFIVSNSTVANSNQQFRCVVTSGNCADTSAPALLTICSPQIVIQPTHAQVFSGRDAYFEVSSFNAGSLFQWQTDEGAGFANLLNGGQYSGVTTNKLTVKNITQTNNNQLFRCIATAGMCADTSTSGKLTLIITIGQPHTEEAAFSVYPNPASSGLIVQIKNMSLIGLPYQLHSIEGKVQVEGKIRQIEQAIDVSNLAEGVYTLNIGDMHYQMVRIVKR